MIYDMFLFFGHGEGDSGATGNGYNEVDLTKELAINIYNLLVGKGVKVFTNINNGYNNYNRNLTSGQNFTYKMGCTIHFNSASGNGNGVEIIVPCKEKYLDVETNILNEFSKIGFTNRGLKSRDYSSEKWLSRTNGTIVNYTNYYKEIREAWDNGNSLSIIETCFISNTNDIKLYQANKIKIAKIIANSYLKEMNKSTYALEEVKNTTSSTSTTSKGYYQVVTGSFKDKENAEKRVFELKNKGFDSFIQYKE